MPKQYIYRGYISIESTEDSRGEQYSNRQTGSVALKQYTQTGRVALKQYTQTGSVALKQYTQTGSLQ